MSIKTTRKIDQWVWINTMKEKGHTPQMDSEGEFVNTHAFVGQSSHHNGPRCSTCKWGSCWHCADYDADRIPQCTGEKEPDRDKLIVLDYRGHYPNRSVLVTKEELEFLQKISEKTNGYLTDYMLRCYIPDVAELKKAEDLVLDLCNNKDRRPSPQKITPSFIIYE